MRRARPVVVWAFLALVPVGSEGGEAPRRATPPAPRVVTSVWNEVAKLGGLVDVQGDEGDQFGYAVALDADTAVVGVPSKDISGGDVGAVLVFFRTGGSWTLQATLAPPSPAAGLHFGSSVAISGDTVVVGAVGDYSPSGKAYVFVRSGQSWTLQATLIGLDTGASDGYGYRVAVSGDTAAVTAPQATTGFGYSSGAVYVFTRTGSVWSQQQKLLSLDLAADDSFGASIALEGDTALVGASLDDTGVAINAGSAYMFSRTGEVWSQRQKLLPSTASAGDVFGAAVSLSGTVAIVGAPGVDSGGVYDTGTAYVFELSGGVWTQTVVLAPASPTSGAQYGTAVAVSGNVAVLGSANYSYYPSAPAQVFRENGGAWTREATLPSATPIPSSFGASVAASGSSLLLGAPNVDATGAAFVFTFTLGAWAQQARLDNTGTTHGDAFGSAVVVDGDTMAVGSPSDDTLAARESGSVTIFTRAAGVWTARQKLVPDSETRLFGRSLAMEGDLLVIGAAPGSYFGPGCAYVFRNSGTWSLEQKLIGAQSDTDFGASVATSGGTVLVGEPNADVDSAYGAGAVSVFIRPTSVWFVQQRLVPPTPAYYARFGASVGLAGDVAAIGEPFAQRAHVFRRSGSIWTSSQVIPASVSQETFGTSIAMAGLDLAIGSPANDFYSDGAAYVFLDTGGIYALVQRLTCSSSSYYVRCGAFVALSGDTLLVGAPYDYISAGPGSVSVFARSGGQWSLRQNLLPSDTPQPGFGVGAAVAGDQILAGAPLAAAGASESGAVYVFGPASSDLSLVMTTSPAVVSQGDLVKVSLLLGNGGATPVPGVGVSIALGAGLVFSSANTGSCGAAPGGAVCAFANVGAGATGSVDFFAAAAAVGTFGSTATVVGGPSAQATTTIVATSADVAVTITTPTAVRRGGILEYWLNLENKGPAAAAAVQVAHPTPPGLLLKSVGDSCLSLPCTIPRIPANGSYSLMVRYEVPVNYAGPDPVVDTATVTPANVDPVPGNNSATGRTPLEIVAATRLSFYTLAPCRLVDTRDPALGGPGPLVPGPASYTAGAGPCGIPYSARAVALNVTATQATAAGYLKLYPQDTGAPLASLVNYSAGQTRSNNGVIGLDGSSRFVVDVGQATGTVHVIVDVVGYFQ